MHLFTLLVAAAFSSQFTTFSNGEPVFTVNFLKVNTNTNEKVKVTPKSGAAAWGTPVSIFLSLDAVVDITQVESGWIEVTGDASDGYETADKFNFASLTHDPTGAIAESDTVYVYVKHGDAASNAVIHLEDPATIDVTDKFWLTADPFDADSQAATNVIIRPPKDGWASATNPVVLCFHDQSVTPSASITWKAIADAAVDGDNYKATTISLTNFTFGENPKIYAYVKYTAAPAYSTEFEIPVPAATKKFTVTMNPATVVADTSAITLATDGDVAWNTSKKLLVTISIDEDHKKEDVSVTHHATNGWQIVDFDMKQLGRRLAADEVSFSVKYDVETAGAGGRLLKVPAKVALTGNPPAATFAVKAPTGINLATVFKFDIQINQTGVSGANAEAWNESVYIFLTKDERELPPVATNTSWKKTTKNQDNTYTLAGVTVASLKPLASGDKVIVWVMHDKTAASSNAAGDGIILPAPVAIPVTGVPPAPTFTTNPATVSLTTTQLFNFTVTQTTQTAAWPKDIEVLLSLADTDPETITTKTTATGSGTTGSVAHQVVEFDLKTLTGIKNGDTIYVFVHYTTTDANAEVYLPVPAKITVTGTFPVYEETFVLEPNWMLWATDLSTTAPIVVTPNQTVEWTTASLLFTYPVPTPPVHSSNAGTKNVSITKNATSGIWSLPTGTNLTDLTIADPTAADAVVQVSLSTGEKVLAHKATFTVRKTAPGPGPETITFTLAPNKMDFATAMKTPVIEVKPGAGADWPKVAVPGALKATFKYGTKADIPVDLAVEGTTTIKYTIPKDVDLSSFGITEAECPKVIKVHIKDGAVDLTHVADFTVNKPGGDAAMGVSPLLSLLAAALLLLVKLF